MSLVLPTPSPYLLTKSARGYEFTSLEGNRYLIYFSDGSGYFPGLAVAEHASMFGFLRYTAEGEDEDEMPPYDQRITATIMHVLELFFADKRNVMCYVCQQGKWEYHRHRLFSIWYYRYNDGRFVRHISSEAQGIFAGIIYSRESPFAWELQTKLPSMEEKLTYY